MHITRKLLSAVLFLSTSICPVLAAPKAVLTWEQFAQKVNYDNKMAFFNGILAGISAQPQRLPAVKKHHELLISLKRLQSSVIIFCAALSGDFDNPAYHRGLLERVKLGKLRMVYTQQFWPALLEVTIPLHNTERHLLIEDIRKVRAARPVQSELLEQLYTCFLQLRQEQQEVEDAQAHDGGQQSGDDELEDAIETPDGLSTELIEALVPTHPSGSDEEMEPPTLAEHQSHDLLVATGTLALAAIGYRTARLGEADRRAAGSLAGLISLAGLTYAAYDHGVYSRVKNWWYSQHDKQD